MRAYGVITNCVVLSSGELASLASDVKLGACLGYIPISDVSAVDDLIVAMQPYNINRAAGRTLSAGERDVYRAEYVSSRIKKLAGVK